MSEVCCLGILVADVVGKPIEAFPPKGTLAAVERMELHVGGCAANTSLALAKLGVETAILGKIGDDGFGQFLAGTLERHGVRTRGLVRDSAEATSATMVAVDAVDALGAGDCWAAGFLCGLVRGWDLERTARLANAAGACAVQALGATTGIRSFEATQALAFGTS